MRIQTSKLAKLTILTLILIAILFGISAVKASSTVSKYWAWRQPPYIITYPYVVPWVEVVAWGGPNKQTLYAGNKDDEYSPGIPQGIYRSNDFGLTWEFLGKVDENEDIATLVVNPSNPNIIFAGFDRDYYQGGIYRTEDGGNSWVSVLPYLYVFDIEIDPNNPDVVYATGLSSAAPPEIPAGIYKSVDSGITWQYFSDSVFNDIEVHPTSPNILFGAHRLSSFPTDGIFRSEDGGVTWTQITSIRQTKIIINESNPNQMFMFGWEYNGIWRTDDGGMNWVDVSSNLPYVISGQSIYTAIIDPLFPNTIWIGLKYDGMYVSHDNGDSWTHESNGMAFIGSGIYGPQCISADLFEDRFSIACSGRLYVLADRIINVSSISSASAYDGWVLETTETSNRGHTVNSTATTLLVGDDSLNRQYRSILSFDTSGLPDNAVITKITLNIKSQGIKGTGDPFSLFNALLVDIVNGNFNAPTLEGKDFQTVAGVTYEFTSPVPASNWYTLDLSSATAFINTTGNTQIRLRFKLDDNNNRKANYISFYSGNASTADRPTLVVEYYTP